MEGSCKFFFGGGTFFLELCFWGGGGGWGDLLVTVFSRLVVGFGDLKKPVQKGCLESR